MAKKATYRRSRPIARRSRKQQPGPLDDPWIFGVLVGLAVLFGLSFDYRIIALLAAFALIGGYVWYVLYKQYQETQRLLRSGIAEIDLMSGVQFERRMAAHFSQVGYKVSETKASGDYGADLVLEKDTITTVAQLKRYSSVLDQTSIREAVAAKAKYQAYRAMVITNSYFTSYAKELARVNFVELWDRDRLISELERVVIDGEIN